MAREMRVKRWGGGAVSLHHRLVVVGGRGRRAAGGEVYSLQDNTWTPLGTGFQCPILIQRGVLLRLKTFNCAMRCQDYIDTTHRREPPLPGPRLPRRRGEQALQLAGAHLVRHSLVAASELLCLPFLLLEPTERVYFYVHRY